jgi:hypothetical protein
MVAMTFKIFSASELPVSFIGACLGAIVSAIITQVLLASQTVKEEINERNKAVFETKFPLFQEYIDRLKAIWENQKITPDNFAEICNDFRIHLMVFLKKETADRIAKHLDKPGDCSIEQMPDYRQLNSNIFDIINILSEDLGFGGTINPEIDKNLMIRLINIQETLEGPY